MQYTALLTLFACANARLVCEKSKMPIELGKWHSKMKHMDSAVVENSPVTISEGQVYVYENYFPEHTIKYIHVDNLAQKTCGASVQIKDGGIGKHTVLIVLHAEANQEIRSVIDVWGTKDPTIPNALKTKPFFDENYMREKFMKSLYLFQGMRAVNHNKGY